MSHNVTGNNHAFLLISSKDLQITDDIMNSKNARAISKQRVITGQFQKRNISYQFLQ